jgi:ADP-ribosylglycohydrolase
MTVYDDMLPRAHGALLGLALGDAVGLPALFHRSIRLGSRRDCLWRVAIDADARRISRHPMPFTVADGDTLRLSGTDDTEMAALAALILLECRNFDDAEELLGAWLGHVDRDDVWLPAADRIALDNVRAGMKPPVSGNDNPAGADDAAVIRAIPIGIRFAGEPSLARTVAMRLAEMTHNGDGVTAAGAMAGLIADLVAGVSIGDAYARMAEDMPDDGWLAHNLASVRAIADEAPSLFAAIPRFHDEVANLTYSYGSIAAETLPIAFAIGARAESVEEAVKTAALIPKQSDSMPAMAGAIAGARFGADQLPASWTTRLERIRGTLIPAVAGMSLGKIARSLLSTGRSNP